MDGHHGPPPERLEPMLARSADRPPAGDEWAFEIKWDGVRVLARIDDHETSLFSRRGEEVTGRYPELAGLGEALGADNALLDGEVVALDDRGVPSFQRLQRRMGLTTVASIRRRVVDTPVSYFAFDLVWLNGRSLIDDPYVERRRLLSGLGLAAGHWQAPRHHVGDGAEVLAAADDRGLEGIVAKRLSSPYCPGRRTGHWLKVRVRKRQEFVIGGYNPGEGTRGGRVGSLLLGYHDADGRLAYAGGVGTGFTEPMLDRLGELLAPLRRPTSPFEVEGPKRRRQAVFCEPRLVCEVEFSEWTREGTLRQPAFKGLRDDKPPGDVVRET